jgi:hypothetical protein
MRSIFRSLRRAYLPEQRIIIRGFPNEVAIAKEEIEAVVAETRERNAQRRGQGDGQSQSRMPQQRSPPEQPPFLSIASAEQPPVCMEREADFLVNRSAD